MQENAQKQQKISEKNKEIPPQIEQINSEPDKEKPDENIPRKFHYQAIKTDGNIRIFKAEESDIFVQKITLKGNNQIQSILPEPLGFNEETGEPQFKRNNTN